MEGSLSPVVTFAPPLEGGTAVAGEGEQIFLWGEMRPTETNSPFYRRFLGLEVRPVERKGICGARDARLASQPPTGSS